LYASVAQKLSIPSCNNDKTDLKQVIKQCVAEVSARQCLLVFNNVKDTSVQPSSLLSTSRAVDLSKFLLHSKLCSIIFITTESNTAKALTPQNVTMLHSLTLDTTLRMLQNCLTTLLLNAEQQDTMHLLEELLHLPLAVVQAAACINASSITVQQYQVQLAKHREVVLKYSNDPSKGKLQEFS
jgi:hypothetical protein